MENVSKFRIMGTLAVSLFALGALAACGDGGANVAVGKANHELLKEAVANMKVLKNFHLETINRSAGSGETKSVGEIDSAHQRFRITQDNQNGHTIITIVGGSLYTSTNNGVSFVREEDRGANSPNRFNTKWFEIKPEDIDKAKDALKDADPPTEMVDGVLTKHITGDIKDLAFLFIGAGSNPPAEGTGDIWVTSDGKPTVRQMRLAIKINGSDHFSSDKWSRLDETINIEAPQIK